MRKVGVVGIAARPRPHSTAGARQRNKAYRQSDKGRLARKFHNMLPEIRFKHKVHREVKRHMKTGV